jgi:hypothetical protein
LGAAAEEEGFRVSGFGFRNSGLGLKVWRSDRTLQRRNSNKQYIEREEEKLTRQREDVMRGIYIVHWN